MSAKYALGMIFSVFAQTNGFFFRKKETEIIVSKVRAIKLMSKGLRRSRKKRKINPVLVSCQIFISFVRPRVIPRQGPWSDVCRRYLSRMSVGG